LRVRLMNELRFTLVGDGRSDDVLLPVISWVLRQAAASLALQAAWADLSRLPRRPRSLVDRIVRATELFPCDLLYVHRDAESRAMSERKAEIQRAVAKAGTTASISRHVSVIPVRMTEAWLLLDEASIRAAASNPNGRMPLSLPPAASWDSEPDPKRVLHDALTTASGLNARRQQQFPVRTAARRVATLVADFSALRALAAFRELEDDTRQALRLIGV
jgi:hypothetical protein